MPLPFLNEIDIHVLEYLKSRGSPQTMTHLRDNVAEGRQESIICSITKLAEEGYVRITLHRDGLTKLVSLEPHGHHALVNEVYAQCD